VSPEISAGTVALTSLAITKSPDTFKVVLHISRKRSTPSIKPMPSGGTPT